MRTREPRREVFFKARMRVDGSWSDVTIRNMSSRGMMLWANDPPKPGAYVEISSPSITLCVRTVWAEDNHFGVRTQDKLDVEAALRGGRWRPAESAAPANDREAKAIHARDVVASHTTSRTQGARMQFGVIFFVVVGAAILIGVATHKLLANPFALVSTSLGG